MKETAKAAAAFNEYCAMGPQRSLRKLAQVIQPDGKTIASESTILVWSMAHGWQQRVREYDKERTEEKRLKREQEQEQMNTEHALLGRTQALRAVKLIEELIKADKFSPQSAVQLFKISTDLERIARGASTEQVSVTGQDAGPLDVVIKTTWGRGADASKRSISLVEENEIKELPEHSEDDTDFL